CHLSLGVEARGRADWERALTPSPSLGEKGSTADAPIPIQGTSDQGQVTNYYFAAASAGAPSLARMTSRALVNWRSLSGGWSLVSSALGFSAPYLGVLSSALGLWMPVIRSRSRRASAQVS